MQAFIGWILLILGSILYIAQIISSINFNLAQRLGIQESAEHSDLLLQRSERYTAYWDLLTLLWLPLAGILMIFNHELWPIMSLIGGAIYLDSSGREAVKNISFRQEGVKTGTIKQQKIFFTSYIVMFILAIFVMAYSISHLTSS